MLSTFQTYQLYSRDTVRVMDRITADPVNKRESEYYRQNIGAVRSIDEFMADYRLYSYALTAFGLAEQIDSRALVRKVLESDLSDPKSFANKLEDDRYRNFAEAFSFDKSAAAEAVVAQSASQSDRTFEAYSFQRVNAANAVKRQVDAYRSVIGEIGSVDEFLQSNAAFETTLTAAGIDPSIASKDFIRDVLTGDAAEGPAANGDDRYVRLKAMLDFDADGAVAAGGLQSPLETNETVRAFFAAKDLLGTTASALNDIEYWKLKMPSVETADQLTQDPRLLDVSLRAVGIDAGVQSSAFVWQILTSDPADPESALNRMSDETDADRALKAKYAEFREAFRFGTDGNVAPGADGAQSADAQQTMFDRYLARNAERTASSDTVAKSLYQVGIFNVKTVSQFVSNSSVYSYALRAFGIDPNETSKTEIANVLKSDPGDPASFAVRSRDERFVALAAAFNFDEAGKIAQKRTAQSDKNFADTIDRFAETFGEEPKAAETKAIDEASEAYRAGIAEIVSVDDFLADRMLVDFAAKAFGITDLRLDAENMRAILTSDLDDPESAVNTMGDQRLREFRAAFEFNSFGGVNRSDPSVQSKADRLKVEELYFRQRLEEEAGAENEGARLALYFQRTAGDLESTFEILADPALLKVVQTAIGLPSEMSQANIDSQKRLLDSRIDLESFRDPEALSRFINRFLAMYDLQNDSGGGLNAASIILGGSGGGLSGFV